MTGLHGSLMSFQYKRYQLRRNDDTLGVLSHKLTPLREEMNQMEVEVHPPELFALLRRNATTDMVAVPLLIMNVSL